MRLVTHSTGGVLVGVVTGVVTATGIAEIRVMLAERCRGERAIFLDYIRAAIAVTEGELAALHARAAPSMVLGTPIAWAVPDEEIAAMWRRQVLRFALSGRRRFVSTDAAAALAWAEKEVCLSAAPG